LTCIVLTKSTIENRVINNNNNNNNIIIQFIQLTSILTCTRGF